MVLQEEVQIQSGGIRWGRVHVGQQKVGKDNDTTGMKGARWYIRPGCYTNVPNESNPHQ